VAGRRTRAKGTGGGCGLACPRRPGCRGRNRCARRSR
jgi:hypothetical protein